MNITPAHSAPPLSTTAAHKAPAASVVPSGPASAQPEQSEQSESSVAKVKLQAPEKVDLGFSAKEMRENIQEAIDRLNQQVKANGRDLSFQMDEEINRPIITVRNIETGEVVRQIPSEEIIRMAHSIEEGKGLLFNESL
jgi:flagellar protein FlaG